MKINLRVLAAMALVFSGAAVAGQPAGLEAPCASYTIPADATLTPCGQGQVGVKYKTLTKDCVTGKVTESAEYNTSQCAVPRRLANGVMSDKLKCSLTPDACAGAPAWAGGGPGPRNGGGTVWLAPVTPAPAPPTTSPTTPSPMTYAVTSPSQGVEVNGGIAQTVTWALPASPDAAVSTAPVTITFSTDSGATWPVTIASNLPNNGTASVTLPLLTKTTVRLKVVAAGNVYEARSKEDFAVWMPADLDRDSDVDCTDYSIVKASLMKRAGQAGFDARADLDKSGLVDTRDLSYVSVRLPAGSKCP
jgi:hypothetical protein